MIRNADLRALDLMHIEEYFQYIIDSYINGQLKQAKELYSDLSVIQSMDFSDWLFYSQVCAIDILNKTEIELVNFLETT